MQGRDAGRRLHPPAGYTVSRLGTSVSENDPSPGESRENVSLDLEEDARVRP